MQAGLLVNEVIFKEEEKDNAPSPLGMENFYFPLGLLLAGLFISALCFLAEIFIKRIENRQ